MALALAVPLRQCHPFFAVSLDSEVLSLNNTGTFKFQLEVELQSLPLALPVAPRLPLAVARRASALDWHPSRRALLP